MPDNDNGKTLVIVVTKLDAIKEDTGEIKASVVAMDKRMRAVEIEQARNEVQHKAIRREMDDQAKDTKRFSAIVSSVESVGVLLGSYLFGK